MLSERYSDRNFSSLIFAGTGYNMGLSYERQLNEKFYVKGAFLGQLSELTHELYPQTISSSFSEIDLQLYRRLFLKNQHKLSLGLGYSWVFEARTMEYGDYSYMQEWLQGLALSPEYQLDLGTYLLRFTFVVPVLSGVSTPSHAGNGSHEFHFASLHNYFSLHTNSSVYFRIAPAQYVGMDYAWHFKNNEVVKSIHKASNAVRVSYMFNF